MEVDGICGRRKIYIGGERIKEEWGKVFDDFFFGYESF